MSESEDIIDATPEKPKKSHKKVKLNKFLDASNFVIFSTERISKLYNVNTIQFCKNMITFNKYENQLKRKLMEYEFSPLDWQCKDYASTIFRYYTLSEISSLQFSSKIQFVKLFGVIRYKKFSQDADAPTYFIEDFQTSERLLINFNYIPEVPEVNKYIKVHGILNTKRVMSNNHEKEMFYVSVVFWNQVQFVEKTRDLLTTQRLLLLKENSEITLQETIDDPFVDTFYINESVFLEQLSMLQPLQKELKDDHSSSSRDYDLETISGSSSDGEITSQSDVDLFD